MIRLTFVKNKVCHVVLLVASLVWLVTAAYVVFGVVSHTAIFLTDIITLQDTSDLTAQAYATMGKFWPIWTLILLTAILVPAWFFTLRRLGIEKKRRLLKRIKQEIAGIHVLTIEDGYVQWTDRSSPLTTSFKLVSRGDTTFGLTVLVDDIYLGRESTYISFAYTGDSFASSLGDSFREMQWIHNMLQQASKRGRPVYPYKPTRLAGKRRYCLEYPGKRRHPMWM